MYPRHNLCICYIFIAANNFSPRFAIPYWISFSPILSLYIQFCYCANCSSSVMRVFKCDKRFFTVVCLVFWFHLSLGFCLFILWKIISVIISFWSYLHAPVKMFAEDLIFVRSATYHLGISSFWIIYPFN